MLISFKPHGRAKHTRQETPYSAPLQYIANKGGSCLAALQLKITVYTCNAVSHVTNHASNAAFDERSVVELHFSQAALESR
jgi:hypothetical protein